MCFLFFTYCIVHAYLVCFNLNGGIEMFIKPLPIGTNPPVDEDRLPVWQVVNGDSWVLTTKLYLEDGHTPALPETSKVTFMLSENRFSLEPFWTATWHTGIEEVDRPNNPGLVKIKIPTSVSDTLRRGAYSFSLTIANRFGKEIRTAMIGNLLVEYEPTSPNHDIPYHSEETGDEIPNN